MVLQLERKRGSRYEWSFVKHEFKPGVFPSTWHRVCLGSLAGARLLSWSACTCVPKVLWLRDN